MSDDERKILALRCKALMHRKAALQCDLAIAMIQATAAFRPLAAILQSTPVEYVVEHPDLAELDLRLDGYYGEGEAT